MKFLKLNNSGWGYRQMVLMSSILLIFLLFATYNIYALYNNLDTDHTDTYIKLETRLEMASLKYIEDNNLEKEKGVVSLYELKFDDYIDEFEDENGNECNGYILYDNLDLKSYIRCKNYTSKNYDDFNE